MLPAASPTPPLPQAPMSQDSPPYPLGLCKPYEASCFGTGWLIQQLFIHFQFPKNKRPLHPAPSPRPPQPPAGLGSPSQTGILTPPLVLCRLPGGIYQERALEKGAPCPQLPSTISEQPEGLH